MSVHRLHYLWCASPPLACLPMLMTPMLAEELYMHPRPYTTLLRTVGLFRIEFKFSSDNSKVASDGVASTGGGVCCLL